MIVRTKNSKTKKTGLCPASSTKTQTSYEQTAAPRFFLNPYLVDAAHTSFCLRWSSIFFSSGEAFARSRGGDEGGDFLVRAPLVTSAASAAARTEARLFKPPFLRSQN